ncbi:MAG: hypothetical protein V1740_01515 [Candidatus Woesearchaeota archaeon]
MAYSDLTGICENILDRPVDITLKKGVYRVQEHIPVQRRQSYRWPVIGSTIASILLAIGCHTTNPTSVRPFDPYSSDGSRNQPALSSDGPDKVISDFDTGQRLRLDNIRSYGGDEPIPPLEPRLMLLPGDEAFEATKLLDNLDFTQLRTVRDLSLDPDKPVYVEDRDSKWSVTIGNTAYNSPLASESMLLMLEEYTGMSLWTYSDMRDNKTLSDIFVMVSRDVWQGEKAVLSVYGTIGGAIWNIQNSKKLGPLALDIDLDRKELYAGLGLTFRPFGRPEYETGLKGMDRLWAMVRTAKPIFEIEGGYTMSDANALMKLDLFGYTAFKYPEVHKDRFWYGNVRVGGQMLLIPENPRRKVLPNTDIHLIVEYGHLFTSNMHNEFPCGTLSAGLELDF